MRQDLLGHPVVDLLPVEVHEDLTRDSLQKSLQQWREHSPEDRGRMMAVYQIKSRIELLERAESTLERNKKDYATGDRKNNEVRD
jgi:hypothetical protein